MDEENRTIRLTENKYRSYSTPEFDSKIISDFAKMTDFEAVSGKNVSYPIPSTPESDGSLPVYNWFAENHAGYDHRKSRTTKMPNARTQMVFAKHMVAMNPEMQSTGFDEYTKQNTGFDYKIKDKGIDDIRKNNDRINNEGEKYKNKYIR